MSAKKRSKSVKTNSRGGAAGNSGRASETAAADATDPREGSDADRGQPTQAAVRTSPRIPAVTKKQEAGEAGRPPLLESVFSPVEIDFFERAADMYADEYDVWEDFRRVEFN